MMRKWIVMMVMAAAGLAAAAQEDGSVQVFIYSPGDREGLHLAWLDDAGQWQHAGQLCASDYGPWGAGKRMYRPSVAHAADGTWRLVFQVDTVSPCLAVAYSEDLVTWRPQDYPRLSGKGCLDPVVFAMDDGTADIYYKDRAGGKHYVQADKDFRHFTEDAMLSTIDDVAWLRDTVTIGERQLEGYLFDITPLHLKYIRQWYGALADDARRSSEQMKDDGERFADLPATVAARLTVDGAEKAISDKLIGVFFEDISYAADGGLYAELVQNRDFEYSSKDRREWSATTAWRSAKPIDIATDHPLSSNNPHYAVLLKDTLRNEGWDGIAVKAGEKYDFSMYVLGGRQKQNFVIQLVDDDGTVLATSKLKTAATDWQRYATVLTATKSSDKARLAIIPKKVARIGIDMVSLFPQDTYKGHGMRRDLAEAIAALKPKFVRFPGGCMSHGQGIGNIYHWNESVGPWQDRKPDMNIWHYHQTRGLGFYEFFQFCEDIGAEPLPVLAAGVPCQNSAADKDGYAGQQGGIAMEEMGAYIDELCHLIEWANGDAATSRWARMRAEAGHPAPFHLKYIGIGNEDLISTAFEERCEMICRAIRERYPEVTICGTVGPFHDPSSDYIEGWRFANEHRDIIDMVDEHYYESPGWFMAHQDYYDGYDRTGAKVYVGEYASRTRTHESALAEALYLCNIERNGDIVAMTSYAPLLAKDGHHNWNPDMIYFNNTSLQLTPSYHTQRIFGCHSGNRYVSSKLKVKNEKLKIENETLADDCQRRLAASVVKDEKTGRTCLKLVNALPREVAVSVEGLSIPASARVEGFTAQPSDKTVTTFSDGETGIVRLSAGESSGAVVTLAPYTVCAVEW